MFSFNAKGLMKKTEFPKKVIHIRNLNSWISPEFMETSNNRIHEELPRNTFGAICKDLQLVEPCAFSKDYHNAYDHLSISRAIWTKIIHESMPGGPKGWGLWDWDGWQDGSRKVTDGSLGEVSSRTVCLPRTCIPEGSDPSPSFIGADLMTLGFHWCQFYPPFHPSLQSDILSWEQFDYPDLFHFQSVSLNVMHP